MFLLDAAKPNPVSYMQFINFVFHTKLVSLSSVLGDRIKLQATIKDIWGMEKKEPSYTVGGNVNWGTVWRFLKKLKIKKNNNNKKKKKKKAKNKVTT